MCDIPNFRELVISTFFLSVKGTNNKVTVELQTTGGTPKAGYLGVIQMTTVQENQRVTMVNHG